MLMGAGLHPLPSRRHRLDALSLRQHCVGNSAAPLPYFDLRQHVDRAGYIAVVGLKSLRRAGVTGALLRTDMTPRFVLPDTSDNATFRGGTPAGRSW